MNTNTSIPGAGAGQLSWIDTWANALTVPTIASFEAIANGAGASPGRAYAWIIFSTLTAYFINVIIQLIFSGTVNNGQIANQLYLRSSSDTTLMLALCGAPVATFCAVAGVLIDSAITQLSARFLGGDGTFSKLIYVTAAYISPLAIISSALAAIPFVWLLNIPLGLYAIYLTMTAVKAVNHFGWSKAALAGVVFPGALALITGLGLTMVLMAIGLAISDFLAHLVQMIPR